MTPSEVAILADSLLARLLLRIAPFAPRRSSGLSPSHWRIWAANFFSRSMRLSFELSWSDAGFTARDSNGQYTTPWSNFIKSKEDGRLFLLYYSDLLFHLVPKQAFPSENSLSEFRSRVQKNVVT